MVDRVVVNQGREVHELHNGGERTGIVVGLSADATRKQEKRGTEQLSLEKEKVLVDLFDHVEFREHDPVKLRADLVQLRAHGRLDRGESCRTPLDRLNYPGVSRGLHPALNVGREAAQSRRRN